MNVARELLRVARLLRHRSAAATTYQLRQLEENRQTLFELHKAADKWLWDAKSDGTVKSVNNAHAQLDWLIKKAMDTQKILSDIGNELSHQHDYSHKIRL